ncbi:MAG: DUF1294 domain-containing protein [Anaerovoracaceae bacterium]|jgi:uncharacterized membrane protein YsdA (DUF1294 family)
MEFGYREFTLILLGWNILTFLVMGIDKRKSIKNKRRISESTLIMLAFFFGSIGVLAAMPVFHHKTKKPLFLILVPIAVVLNILMLIGGVTLMK